MNNQVEVTLEEQEQIIWQGRTKRHQFFSHGDMIFIPYSIFVGGFLLFCAFLIVKYQAPILLQLLGVVLMIIGIYWILGRMLYRYWKMAQAQYIVTNRRILVQFSHKILKNQVMRLSDFDKMVRIVEPDGTGTLLFGNYHPAILYRVNTGTEIFKPKLRRIIGFYHIPECEKVFSTIKALQMNEEL